MFSLGLFGARLPGWRSNSIPVTFRIVRQFLITTRTYCNDVLAGVAGKAWSSRLGRYVRGFGRHGSRGGGGDMGWHLQGRERVHGIVELYVTQSNEPLTCTVLLPDALLTGNDNVVIRSIVAGGHGWRCSMMIQHVKEGHLPYQLCKAST